MKQRLFAAALFAVGLLLTGDALADERETALVGCWYTELFNEKKNKHGYFLSVRTDRKRCLLKKLFVNHNTKEYCYDTEVVTWSLEGGRYTETLDDAAPDEELYLGGEVLDLTEKVFRYRMTRESEGEEKSREITEKRVVGSEYPLPKPPKGYAKVSADEYFDSDS